MKYALILVCALFASSPVVADCAHDWMSCTADSQIKLGSFSLRAAEVIGSITASRLTTFQRLQGHLITGAQAQHIQNKADRARVLWEQARDVCHENAAGDCRTKTDSAKAFALLTSAQRAVQ